MSKKGSQEKETKKEEKSSEKKEKKVTLASLKEDYEKKLEEAESRLAQALDLNQKLIAELESHEKQLSVFSEAKVGLENVIESQQGEIENLRGELDSYYQAIRQEKINDLANRWMKKFNLSSDKLQSVVEMLSKFESDDDLETVEQVLGIPKTEERPKVVPRPVTQTSESLSRKSAPSVDFAELSPAQKREALFKQMEKYGQKID